MKNILSLLPCLSVSCSTHAAGPLWADLGGLTLPCATCHGLPGEKNNAMNLYGIKEEIFLINSNLFSCDQIKIGVMHYISRAYSDDDIRRMATYFAEKQ